MFNFERKIENKINILERCKKETYIFRCYMRCVLI